MSDDLDTLFNEQLNEVFAVEVAGLKPASMSIKQPPDPRLDGVVDSAGKFHYGMPSFSTDANAVLPWLDRIAKGGWRVSGAVNGWIVSIWQCKGEQPDAEVRASTLPRAAAIALIRGKRTAK